MKSTVLCLFVAAMIMGAHAALPDKAEAFRMSGPMWSLEFAPYPGYVYAPPPPPPPPPPRMRRYHGYYAPPTYIPAPPPRGYYRRGWDRPPCR